MEILDLENRGHKNLGEPLALPVQYVMTSSCPHAMQEGCKDLVLPSEEIYLYLHVEHQLPLSTSYPQSGHFNTVPWRARTVRVTVGLPLGIYRPLTDDVTKQACGLLVYNQRSD